MAVAGIAVGEDGFGGDVQCGKESRLAVANMVEGHAFQIGPPHGQHWLVPAQGMSLRLLVHSQHDGIIRRIQVHTQPVQIQCLQRVGSY